MTPCLANDLPFSGVVPSISEDHVRLHGWLDGTHGPPSVRRPRVVSRGTPHFEAALPRSVAIAGPSSSDKGDGTALVEVTISPLSRNGLKMNDLNPVADTQAL